MARKGEDELVDEMTIDWIRRYSHPQRRMSACGSKRTHSIEKLDFACFDMASTDESYRHERDGALSKKSDFAPDRDIVISKL